MSEIKFISATVSTEEDLLAGLRSVSWDIEDLFDASDFDDESREYARGQLKRAFEHIFDTSVWVAFSDETEPEDAALSGGTENDLRTLR